MGTLDDLLGGFGRRRLRNHAVSLLEQEANKDPRWPVPPVVSNIKTALDKAFRAVQLRACTRFVAKQCVEPGKAFGIGRIAALRQRIKDFRANRDRKSVV